MSFRDGPPGFEPLDWSRPIIKHRRKLPHWTQDGATYFITFRLFDSLPQDKLRELERFRATWISQHSDADTDPGSTEGSPAQKLHRETLRKVEEWLDAGSGACWLHDPACAAIVSRALHHFHEQRCFLSCHCIMPNHVHVIVRPFVGFALADILHSWKSFTAKEINRRLGRTGEVWEAESHDTLIRDTEHLWKAIRYIGNNPTKARIPQDRWQRYIHPQWQKAGWDFEPRPTSSP